MDSEDLSCCVLSINEINYCDSMVLSIFETYPKCFFLSKPILVGGLEHVIFHNRWICFIPVVPHKAVAEVSKIGNL